MIIAFPTLIISRRPRHLGESWNDARSWFGGKPQLGEQAWPRVEARQTPFYFVAQIDLAEVAREVQRFGESAPLPDGALAFFIGVGDDGRYTGVVVHVPRSQLGEPTEPPPDAPPVLSPGGPFSSIFYHDVLRLFPRWPVDITALDLELDIAPDIDDEVAELEAREALAKAQVTAVERLFRRRECFFEAKEAFKLLGDAPHPFWWHSAQHYAACLRTVLNAVPQRIANCRRGLETARSRLERLRPTRGRGVLSALLGLRSNPPTEELKNAEGWVVAHTAELTEFDRLLPEFESFVQEVGDWAGGKDPWQFIPPQEVAALASNFERGKRVFGAFTRFYTPQFIDALETQTLLALATAEDPAYATMPEAVRTLINTHHLLAPGQRWHQMFGRGVSIQVAVDDNENEGNLMLLQLVYDDMMHWDFGDMGAFQFWISPDELAHGNWAAVRVTFESH